jgi:hypothetical protein
MTSLAKKQAFKRKPQEALQARFPSSRPPCACGPTFAVLSTIQAFPETVGCGSVEGGGAPFRPSLWRHGRAMEPEVTVPTAGSRWRGFATWAAGRQRESLSSR